MDEYLTMVGLTPPKEQGKFHQLSGDKARAYIARVLAVGADVILQMNLPLCWMYQ